MAARDNAEQGDMMYNLETKLWKSCSSRSVCASLHGIDHDIHPPKFDDGFDVRKFLRFPRTSACHIRYCSIDRFERSGENALGLRTCNTPKVKSLYRSTEAQIISLGAKSTRFRLRISSYPTSLVSTSRTCMSYV